MTYRFHGLTGVDGAARLEKELAIMDSVIAVSVNFPTSTLSTECQDLEEVKKNER